MLPGKAKQCTAKAKSTGERCKNPAVTGRNVCRLHGGKAGRPIIHGRYSTEHRKSLAEKHERFLQDNEPGDLTQELAMMRTLFQEYLDRFGDGILMTGDDVERMFDMLDTIGKLVQRIGRIFNETQMTQNDVRYLQAVIIDVLNTYIDDSDKRAQAVGELRRRIGSDRSNRSGVRSLSG